MIEQNYPQRAPDIVRRFLPTTAMALVLILLLGACSSPPSTDSDAEDWISLFNGRDLENWVVKIAGSDVGDNYLNTFKVRDGIIVVDYREYDSFDNKFGVLVYSRPYSYYRLAVEYRFTGDQIPGGPGWAFRNSGVMIHSQSAESMLRDQDFPISIEVQLLGGDGTTDRTTANLCTPGTNVVIDGELITQHCISSISETYHGDGWVHLEVEVLGSGKITHLISGESVLEYEAPQAGGGSVSGHDPELIADGQEITGGYISLQSESHPVEFRSVELLNLRGCLNQDSEHYRSYFVISDPVAC